MQTIQTLQVFGNIACSTSRGRLQMLSMMGRCQYQSQNSQ